MIAIQLQADVYDALQRSSETYGGIGGAQRFRNDQPCCIIGHAQCLDGIDGGYDVYEARGRVLDGLRTAFRCSGRMVADKNDDVINLDEGRISFAQWCKRLHVVRASR